MSERTMAAGRVIQDAMDAFGRGDLTDAPLLGFRLMATALAMTDAHQRGALKIARDYCDAVGLSSDLLEEQVRARMYEVIQLAAMGLEVSDD